MQVKTLYDQDFYACTQTQARLLREGQFGEQVDEVDAPDLAARLKSAREADERSLAEICQQVGVSPQYWYNLERGAVTTMSFETLRKIEDVLDVDFGVKL